LRALRKPLRSNKTFRFFNTGAAAAPIPAHINPYAIPLYTDYKVPPLSFSAPGIDRNRPGEYINSERRCLFGVGLSRSNFIDM
jgi:hypothetical protein